MSRIEAKEFGLKEDELEQLIDRDYRWYLHVRGRSIGAMSRERYGEYWRDNRMVSKNSMLSSKVKKSYKKR